MFAEYLMVGLGGFLGATARYGVSSWIGHRAGWSDFPLGTFFVNVSGCFFIALIMAVMAERFLANPHWRLLITVGFLGSYTTFSTFEYETGSLLRDGEWLIAGANVILSLAAGFLALKLGELLARAL